METIATIATICAAWAGGIDYCSRTTTQQYLPVRPISAPSPVPTNNNFKFRVNDSHAKAFDTHAGQRVVQQPVAPRPR